jgi:hypothetical protein
MRAIREHPESINARLILHYDVANAIARADLHVFLREAAARWAAARRRGGDCTDEAKSERERMPRPVQ